MTSGYARAPPRKIPIAGEILRNFGTAGITTAAGPYASSTSTTNTRSQMEEGIAGRIQAISYTAYLTLELPLQTLANSIHSRNYSWIS